MEGLEVSEVKYQEVVSHTASCRFDAEYFRKEYLLQDQFISKIGFLNLKDATKKIDVGFVGPMVQHYRDEGVPLLQTKNINAFFVADAEIIKITETFHAQLKKSQVQKEDILIARSGSFGKASIYLKDETVNSSDIIIIQSDKDIVNPYFLTAFLNSAFGVNQMIRFASGGLQGHVNLTILEELVIPKVDLTVQLKIEDIIKLAFVKQQSAQKTYAEAERILFTEVGLEDFTPSTDPVNIKNFSESFAASGRLDAEYYQKKYEQVIANLKAQPHDALTNLVTISKSIEPGSAHYAEDGLGLPFLRVADYSKHGTTQPQKYLSGDFVKANKKLIEQLKPKKGTILFSKDGSVGAAYHLREDMDCITSGAILHLKVKDEKRVIPEYLTLALNSNLVQMQAERDAGGSIILHWRVSEIENVVVPVIDYTKQREIAALVEKCFVLKQQSENLLDVAKRAVEVAIEQDEASALNFIKENA